MTPIVEGVGRSGEGASVPDQAGQATPEAAKPSSPSGDHPSRDFGSLDFTLRTNFLGVQGWSEDSNQIRNFAAMLMVLADTFEQLNESAVEGDSAAIAQGGDA